jgi:hypothetical protein
MFRITIGPLPSCYRSLKSQRSSGLWWHNVSITFCDESVNWSRNCNWTHTHTRAHAEYSGIISLRSFLKKQSRQKKKSRVEMCHAKKVWGDVINIVTYLGVCVTYRRGFGLMTGFIAHLYNLLLYFTNHYMTHHVFSIIFDCCLKRLPQFWF